MITKKQIEKILSDNQTKAELCNPKQIVYTEKDLANILEQIELTSKNKLIEFTASDFMKGLSGLND